jgi:hypothetical protein
MDMVGVVPLAAGDFAPLVGEVGLSDGSFCFPFKAQVIKHFSFFDRFLTFKSLIGRA